MSGLPAPGGVIGVVRLLRDERVPGRQRCVSGGEADDRDVADPGRGSGKLVLFDLDGTLVDRDRAFRAWAGEFAAAHGLTDRQLAWLIFAGARHAGPMERFLADARDELGLTGPAAGSACGEWLS